MLTPQDVRNMKFSKALKGHAALEVEEAIKRIAADFEKLYQDNKDLNKNLQVAVSKLEEYKGQEDTLRTVLITAQRTADDILAEANQKSAQLLAEANIKAESLIAAATQEAEERVDAANYQVQTIISNHEKDIKAGKSALEQMQKEVSQFKVNMITAYKGHLEMLQAIDSGYKEELENSKKVEEELTNPRSDAEAAAQISEPDEPAAPAAEEQQAASPKDKPFMIKIKYDEEEKQSAAAPAAPASAAQPSTPEIPAVPDAEGEKPEAKDSLPDLKSLFGQERPKRKLKFGENYRYEDDDD